MKKKSTLNSSIIVFILFFFVILLLIENNISYSVYHHKNNGNLINQGGSINSLVSKDDNNIRIKLSFIGDSLIGTYKGQNFPGNFRNLLENNSYNYPFKYVSGIFKNDDYTVANGENVFTDNDLNPIEKNYNPAYWYYAPSRFANVYKVSSIEVVSIMNNHSNDYGNIGYNDTKEAIKDAGLILGAEDPVIIEKDDIKIGIICTNLFHRSQYDECLKKIKNIRDEVNYLIIYFHGGTEYLFSPTDEIIEYSHGFIDNGADLVIGCHPHVLEPREIYKDKRIIYSLGSFLFSNAGFVNRTIIYQMNLVINKNTRKIEEFDNIIPCYLYTENDYLIPSIIKNVQEKQKVLDFMNGLVDKPI